MPDQISPEVAQAPPLPLPITEADEIARRLRSENKASPVSNADPRHPIQANFRVLARTNVILKAAPSDSAEGS